MISAGDFSHVELIGSKLNLAEIMYNIFLSYPCFAHQAASV